ncbi:hypothetical protein MUG94_08420 [Arthrobacter gengyunqii]|uniref:Uncharacterized protein n=1 Tax=Arthrobacter gengyunqii TaxID=2886940 RepID=A0A9X1S6Y3_9MICC|nr:hypothetical protein [Arthrobacter gengyunqii]MCC3269427.1 hypothetical protein [Arthrobacter gengyunqii]UOY97733.1 hypothetical protein MUG94_08420 [Arthrobacter gengyunqii]
MRDCFGRDERSMRDRMLAGNRNFRKLLGGLGEGAKIRAPLYAVHGTGAVVTQRG